MRSIVEMSAAAALAAAIGVEQDMYVCYVRDGMPSDSGWLVGVQTFVADMKLRGRGI